MHVYVRVPIEDSPRELLRAGDVLVRRQEEHNFTLFILDWNDVEETPEGSFWKKKLFVYTKIVYTKY